MAMVDEKLPEVEKALDAAVDLINNDYQVSKQAFTKPLMRSEQEKMKSISGKSSNYWNLMPPMKPTSSNNQWN